MSEMTAEQMARRWIELYSDGTPDSYGSDRVLDLYADGIDWREMPSSLFPEGRTGDRATVSKGIKRNQAVLRNRKAQEVVPCA